MLALRSASRRLLKPRFNLRQNSTASPPSSSTRPPEEETFSKGFFLTLAAITGTLAAYKFERSISGGDKSPITRVIEKYADTKQMWIERNDRHTQMVERAAADRSLFQDSKGSRVVALKFPEVFNTGSPYNHAMGMSGGDLSELYKHFEKQK